MVDPGSNLDMLILEWSDEWCYRFVPYEMVALRWNVSLEDFHVVLLSVAKRGDVFTVKAKGSRSFGLFGVAPWFEGAAFSDMNTRRSLCAAVLSGRRVFVFDGCDDGWPRLRCWIWTRWRLQKGAVYRRAGALAVRTPRSTLAVRRGPVAISGVAVSATAAKQLERCARIPSREPKVTEFSNCAIICGITPLATYDTCHSVPFFKRRDVGRPGPNDRESLCAAAQALSFSTADGLYANGQSAAASRSIWFSKQLVSAAFNGVPVQADNIRRRSTKVDYWRAQLCAMRGALEPHPT